MARKTPPLRAKGFYEVRAPFTVISNSVYECIALRSFDDFTERGEDVFKRFYLANGLSQTDYENDRAANTHIVTLQSATSALVFVPDTYIEKMPDMTGVEYKRIVLSVLLGPLPDSVDLTHLKTSVGQLVSDITGVTGVVLEHAAPYSGAVSAEQHATLELGRQAAINNRTTDRADLLTAQATIDAQRERILALEELLRQR